MHKLQTKQIGSDDVFPSSRPTLIRSPSTQPPEPKTSRLAFTSTALGLPCCIIWASSFVMLSRNCVFELGLIFTLIGAPLAVVLGTAAMIQIRFSPVKVGGLPLAKFGIVTGAITMLLIILALTGILHWGQT